MRRRVQIAGRNVVSRERTWRFYGQYDIGGDGGHGAVLQIPPSGYLSLVT